MTFLNCLSCVRCAAPTLKRIYLASHSFQTTYFLCSKWASQFPPRWRSSTSNIKDQYLLFNVSPLDTEGSALNREHTKNISTHRKRVCAVSEHVGSTTTPFVKKDQDLLGAEPVEANYFDTETQESHDLLEALMKSLLSVCTTHFKYLMEFLSAVTGEDGSEVVDLVFFYLSTREVALIVLTQSIMVFQKTTWNRRST